MATERICTIEGCGKRHEARGLCAAHYKRWRTTSDGLVATKQETKLEYLKRVVVPFSGNDCLLWPFAKTNQGRAELWYNGKVVNAARLACRIVHGKPPSEGLHAAHSCGNGHLGCVNPQHLRWATPAENSKDMISHGRAGPGTYGCRLSEAEVAAIRRDTRPHRMVAEAYGVGNTTILDIRARRSWKHIA
jgi:hypothetical protein